LDDVLQLGGGDGHDERAALRVQAQEPLGLEQGERAADRRAADPERLGDLALGDQLAARQAAVEHALLDVAVGALARRRGPRLGPAAAARPLLGHIQMVPDTQDGRTLCTSCIQVGYCESAWPHSLSASTPPAASSTRRAAPPPTAAGG